MRSLIYSIILNDLLIFWDISCEKVRKIVCLLRVFIALSAPGRQARVAEYTQSVGVVMGAIRFAF